MTQDDEFYMTTSRDTRLGYADAVANRSSCRCGSLLSVPNGITSSIRPLRNEDCVRTQSTRRCGVSGRYLHFYRLILRIRLRSFLTITTATTPAVQDAEKDRGDGDAQEAQSYARQDLHGVEDGAAEVSVSAIVP